MYAQLNRRLSFSLLSRLLNESVLGPCRLITTFVVASCVTVVFAQTTTWTDGGPTNNWTDALNWDNGIPTATSLAILNGSSPTLSGAIPVGSLEMDAATTVAIPANGSITVSDGSVVNNGLITLGFTNSLSGLLRFDTVDALLSGSGVVDITGLQTSDSIDTSNVVLTNGVNHTIRGSGYIQADLINEGLIDADNSGLTLFLNDKDKINTGTLRASLGTLNITGIELTNVGANLESMGGELRISDGATIKGGTLSGGDIDFATATIENVHFASGSLTQIEANNTLTFAGPNITNDGTMELGFTSSAAGTIFVANSTTLDGAGEIHITGAQTNDNIDSDAGAVLTQAAGHTIRGSGYIQAALANNGVVNADNSGLALVLNDKNKTNNNLMTATEGGILRLESVQIENSAGQIVADGGHVDFTGATIVGGELRSTPGSMLRVAGNSTFQDVSLPTAETVMTINNAQVATISGGSLSNHGSIQFGSTSSTRGTMVFDGQIDLVGNGEIDIAGAQANDNIDSTAGSVVTQSEDHTIRGSGYIQAALANNGVVNADNSGLALVLNDKNKTNNNLMTATEGGILRLESVQIENSAGQIVADGGRVDFTGATIVGGELRSTPGSMLQVAGNSTFQDVSLPTAETVMTINNAQVATISGGSLSNHGSIQFGSTSSTRGTMVFDGQIDLVGNGEIDIAGAQANDNIDSTAGSVVTQSEDHTIRGSGYIQAALANNGVVNADNSGLALVLNDKNKTNNNLMTATEGGILRLESVQIENSAGQIVADGGRVDFTGATIVGGELRSTPGSMLQVAGNSTFQDVSLPTAETVMIINNAQVATISGGSLSNHGSIQFGSTSSTSGTMLFDGQIDLVGNGEIDIAGAQANDAMIVTMGSTMTHASSHTIRGSGFLFGDIENEGLIMADNGGLAMVIDPDGAPAPFTDPNAIFTNAGILRAESGGRVELRGDSMGTVQFSNAGTIEALSGSTILAVDTTISQLGSTVAEGTYRAINGTLNIAPIGYQPAINNAIIEVVGSGTNDVLGIKTGATHFNDQLVQNNGSIRLSDGANLTLTLPAPRGGPANLVSTGDLLVGSGSTLDASARMTTFMAAGDTTEFGLLVNGGTLSGSGTIAGGVYMPAGTLSPGDADRQAGLLSITGDFNMDDPGVLAEESLTIIELGGAVRGDDYDSFAATGDFFGQGVLEARLINDFLPMIGDEFVLATYVENGNRVGNQWEDFAFNRVRFELEDRSTGGSNRETILRVLEVRDVDFGNDGNIDCDDVDALVMDIVSGTNNLQFDLNFDGIVGEEDLKIWLNDAGISVLGSENGFLPGDANLDGFVDGADFTIWSQNKFTTGGGWCSGDFDADGVVGGHDFLVWNAFKSQTSGLLTRQAAVPEPTVSLIGLLFVSIGIMRGRLGTES